MKHLILITSLIASTNSLFTMEPLEPSITIFNNDKTLILTVRTEDTIKDGITSATGIVIKSNEQLTLPPHAYNFLNKQKIENTDAAIHLSIYNIRTKKHHCCNLYIGGENSIIKFGDDIRVNRNKDKSKICIIHNDITTLEMLHTTDFGIKVGLKENEDSFIPYKKRKLSLTNDLT